MYQPYPSCGQRVHAAAASCSCGRDPEGALEPGITWYDVLGVLPGAEARKIKQKYEEKAGLLRPELISGAPPDVATAVRRAQGFLDTAWEVLGDPQSRKRYDQAAGLRRSGGGLGQPGTGIESVGLAPADPGIIGELPGVDVAGGLLELTGWLGPRRRRNRRGAIPDVRGLFYQVCLEVATRHGLHVRTVRLTERPMAVDGLVVGQDPRPPAKAHRGGTLTVQVWHPSARPAALIASRRPSVCTGGSVHALPWRSPDASYRTLPRPAERRMPARGGIRPPRESQMNRRLWACSYLGTSLASTRASSG